MTSSTELKEKKCSPCEGEMAPLDQQQVQTYLRKTPDWKADSDCKKICREYTMKDFLSAVAFIQEIAEIAEDDNHHPDIHLTGYRNLKVVLSTHKISGLSENDFIVAAKIDDLKPALKQ